MEEGSPSKLKFAKSTPDWILRVVIFALFVFFGTAKFTTNPTAPWAVLFRQLGLGQWLRYLTGVFEVLGAFLVLIPRTVPAGLIVLMGTMSAATFIVLVELHRLSNAFVAFALLTGLLAFWLHRR